MENYSCHYKNSTGTYFLLTAHKSYTHILNNDPMTRAYILLLTLLAPHTLLAEDGNIEWLNWPVTGYPYSGIDPGILIPPASTRFSTEVRRDVVIGLRSDGTVVWKKLKQESHTKNVHQSDDITSKILPPHNSVPTPDSVFRQYVKQILEKDPEWTKALAETMPYIGESIKAEMAAIEEENRELTKQDVLDYLEGLIKTELKN